MRVLDLFSGIGGFSLGLERAGMQTVAFCESDPFCQKVLRKHWPDVPIHEDITELDGSEYKGTVDLVCGGFPCQPFSLAGKRNGAADDRALWPEMFRVIRQVQPAWVIGENVAGIVYMELDTVLADLERAGYACQAFVIPACAVDAPHRRDRVWIIGNASSYGQPTSTVNATVSRELGAVATDADGQRGRTEQIGELRSGNQAISRDDGEKRAATDASSPRLEGFGYGYGFGAEAEHPPFGDPRGWAVEPSIRGVGHGVPNRVHRIRSLGNAVVPQVVEAIGRAIIALEKR